MERTLFRFIVRFSLKEQVRLIVLTAISFPFLYFSLDLPKIIINEAIGGKATFPVEAWFGLTFEQVPYLLTLSGAFLLLVCINGAFKYAINVYSGVVGERMLRRLRYTLFRTLMRFPLPYFRKVGQGEVVSMVVAETEPLAGFIGDSVKLPAFQGGTLLTILVFMFVQDWVLGIAAIALYPVQGFLIPRLQARVNRLKRSLVLEKRQLSERIGEVVAGIQEVHSNDTSEYEGALFSERLSGLYALRLQLFRRKFFIKFLNNFLAQVTPFFFYAIGGVLVIGGDLTFGALVAVLAAYKDLNAPWKELLNYYQLLEDARIKYELLCETFTPEGLMDPAMQSDEPDPLPRLTGELQVTRLDVREEADSPLVGGITFRTRLTRKVAIVGGSGSGGSRLAGILARLYAPLSGRVTIGELDLESLPETVTGRRIGYVGSEVRIRTGTLLDNLLYGLKHRPRRDPDYRPDEIRAREDSLREALAAGNSPYDAGADWVDYDATSCGPEQGIVECAIRSLTIADLHEDVYRLGLQGRIDPSREQDLTERIMTARTELRQRLQEPDVAGLVEPFDRGRYNTNMTVAENLLFGTPRGAAFDPEAMSENAYVRKVLQETGLMAAFLSMGRQLAELMVDIFADVAPDSDLFEQFSFISADDLPEFRALLGRTSRDALGNISAEDRRMLLALPFKLVAARHRLGLVDEAMQTRLLRAREVFAGGFGDGAPPVDTFDAERYNASSSIQDNILFGRLAYGRARSAAVVGGMIREVVERQGLLDSVMEVGLGYQVGIGGARLTSAQRQKLAIARALLKNPDLLIFDDATAPLDIGSQERIRRSVLEAPSIGSLIWVIAHAKVARDFDEVFVLDGERVAESGTFEDLATPGTLLHSMLAEG